MSEPTKIVRPVTGPVPVVRGAGTPKLVNPEGPAGPPGPRGKQGETPTLEAAAVTLQPGTEASATLVLVDGSHYRLDLGIPSGEPGEAGEPGPAIELRKGTAHLQWRVQGTTAWTDLVALDDLRGRQGDQGAPGDKGAPGQDGRQVELRAGTTAVEWRWVGEAAWQQLVTLEQLRGPKGDIGEPGRDGDPGPAGDSAYEVAVANGFVGTEVEWLASLRGPQGDTGDPGDEGPPGADGAPGVGVPPGGTTGQVPAKASAADYDITWVDQTGGDGGGAVDSVNGQTGTVVLDAEDVGAALANHNHDGRYVRTVNGTGPDANGNVVVEGSGGGGVGLDQALRDQWVPEASYQSGEVVLHKGATYVARYGVPRYEPGTEPQLPDNTVQGTSGTSDVHIGSDWATVYQRIRLNREVSLDHVALMKDPAGGSADGTFQIVLASDKTGNGTVYATSATRQWAPAGTETVFSMQGTLPRNVDLYLVLRRVAGSTAALGLRNGSLSTTRIGAAGVPPAAGEELGTNGQPFSSDYAMWHRIREVSSAQPVWAVLARGPRPRTVAVKTTASLPSAGREAGTITMAQGYRVLKLATDRPARVRLYTTTAKRDADATRPSGTDPTGNHGLLLERTTTVQDLTWDLSPVVDGFSDTANIPITVENLGAAGPVTVTLTYVPTE